MNKKMISKSHYILGYIILREFDYNNYWNLDFKQMMRRYGRGNRREKQKRKLVRVFQRRNSFDEKIYMLASAVLKEKYNSIFKQRC